MVFGGDARNITDEVKGVLDVLGHVEQDTVKFDRSGRQVCDVVILITKWSSHKHQQLARVAAKQRGVPLVYARTGNQVVPGLERYRLLPRV